MTITEAATRLGIDAATLYNRIKRLSAPWVFYVGPLPPRGRYSKERRL